MLTHGVATRIAALLGLLGATVCAEARQVAVQTSSPAVQATAPGPTSGPAEQRSAGSSSHHPVMTNADVVEMVKNHLDSASVVSAIGLNESQFDVTPEALIALKQAGVEDPVIAAMLEAARRKQSGTSATSGAPAAAPGGMPSGASAGLPSTSPGTPGTSGTSGTPAMPAMPALDPQTAARVQAAMARLQGMGYGSAASMPFAGTGFGGTGSVSAPAVHVFLLGSASRMELVASYAERAMSKVNTGGMSDGASLLRSIASEGLRFVALGAGPSGMAAMTGFSMFSHFLPGMGPSRPSITYAWGLPGSHSDRALAPTPSFEFHYADIPGIDPDAYEPVLLHLVLTKDNYRLLGVSRQKLGRNMGMTAMGGGSGDWIAEDRVAAKLEKQGRGLYTLRSDKPLATGEYAVVLRPVKGYTAQSSAFGGGDQLSSAAWDFSTPTASR